MSTRRAQLLLAAGAAGFALVGLLLSRRRLERAHPQESTPLQPSPREAQLLPAPAAAPSAQPAPAVRSAEKARVASCEFADAMARLSVDTFRRLCSVAGLHYEQTCVAAIVALCVRDDGTSSLVVLSLGAGTKFTRAADVASDACGDRLRDCHAEPLARRGLQRYFRCELQRCLQTGSGGDGDSGGGSALLAPPSRAGGSWTLRPGVSLHLYSSSAPCGNASVRPRM